MFFESLLAYQWLGVVLLACIAASIGSFINVVAHRLPIMLQRQWSLEYQQPSQHTETTLIQGDTFNLATPRSHCPKCGEQLRILDNLPLLSWLLLRGRCRFCQEAIAARYPLVELSAVLLGLAVVGVYGYSVQSLFYCGFAWTLLTLLLIDYDTGLFKHTAGPHHPTLVVGRSACEPLLPTRVHTECRTGRCNGLYQSVAGVLGF